MTTLKDYVVWKLTHGKKFEKKSRNLFDKDNLILNNRYLAVNEASTDTGVQFYTTGNCTATAYPQLGFRLGLASDFKGKTITFSSPDIIGTSATKLSVRRGSTALQNGSNWTKYGNVYYSTITLEDKDYANDEYLCIVFYAYGKGANELISYNEIMVNEGSIPLPYEPYK